MNYYDENGYINEPLIMGLPYPFIFQVGGRGTGKTYGILKELLHSGKRFLYLRRSKVEIDFAGSAHGNPFKSIPGGEGIYSKKIEGLYVFFQDIKHEDGEIETALLGYGAALSTFANLRGVDLSDVEIIFFDEFIPERSKHTIRDEFETLLNLYETVNRNRELQGKQAVKLIAAANANDLTNPVFMGLQLVDKLFSMIKAGRTEYFDASRGLAVLFLYDSPVSAEKAATALYRLAGSSSFSAMALQNAFALDESGIKSRKLTGMKPLCSVGELVIYQARGREIYVRSGNAGKVKDVYTTSDADIARFVNLYRWLIMSYMYEQITFESMGAKVLFLKLFGL